jgi:hypothetical protein
MNQILAKRYAFCNFSSISGYPHLVPTRDEWERSIPRFRGEKWEVPAEHLLDFHDFIDRLEIVHEDVQIKLFKFSLEGIALDWCQSLPDASVSSLADFHAAFHVFCKDQFSADLLFPECCHEFNLSKLELREEYTAEENTLHHDHEINNPHYDNLSDAFAIISNASTVVSCHEDQIFLSENFEDVEQIDRSASNSFRSAEDDEGSVQLSDLQTHENCSKYEEKSEELKDSDQQFILYIPSSDLEQSVFSIETRKGDGEQKELDQQVMMHVFLSDVEQPALYEFQDPIAIWMDSRSSLMSYITEFGIMV